MYRLMIIAILFMASCSKSNPGCYTCEFGNVNGHTHDPVEWCGDPQHQFTDDQGNPLQATCKAK